MASKDSLEIKKLAAKGKVYQRGDDGSVAIRLRYVGTGTITAGTAVTLTTATKLVLTTSAGAVDYTFAGGAGYYGTMGLLCDGINASGIWEAKLLDCLSSDITTASNFKINTNVSPSTDENGVPCYDLVTNNNVTLTPTVCFSPFYNFDSPKGHQAIVRSVSYNENTGTEATSSWAIYKRAKNTNAETLIMSKTGLGTANVTDLITWGSGFGFITGDVDADMIFRVTSDSITDDPANLVQITGTLE